MSKRLKFSFILSVLSLFSLSTFAEVLTSAQVCGRFELQGEGLYDGFIFSGQQATVLSIEEFTSPYYIEDGKIHIPHNRGSEFLLEIQQQGDVLRGQDFWTNGTAYKKTSSEGC